MTIAIDRKTDKVLGQVVLEDALREAGTIRILTAEGYRVVREGDVKLERMP